MATLVNPNKVQFQPLPTTITPTTEFEWIAQDTTVSASAGFVTSLLVSDVVSIVADSDGPSWIQLDLVTATDTYRFYQAEVFYILDYLLANATFTPLPSPF